MKKLMKAVTKVKASIKDLTHKKAVVLSKIEIPDSPTSRVVVLRGHLQSLKLKKGQSITIDLNTLKINKKSFVDLISSRACIGTTTRAGLSEYTFKCLECVQSPTLNKKLYVKFIATKV